VAFASVGAEIKSSLGNVPYYFQIHGKIDRFVSLLCLNEANKLGYRQLYIFDSAEATTKWPGNQ
jgi:hypothetical protein